VNTGGPAFPLTASTGDPRDGVYCQNGMTLLDWMAGQALVGLLSNPDPMPWDKVHPVAYDHASAMLAEKARREADHSGDANKMVPDPFAETTLRRLAADVLPADIKDAAYEQTLVWCAEQVRARVNTLESLNRELVEALEKLLARDQRNTCQHEETHRGGVLCEICDNCKVSWADDEGGKPPWSDPTEWIAAEAALSKAKGGA